MTFQRSLGAGKKEWAYKRKCSIAFKLRDRRCGFSVLRSQKDLLSPWQGLPTRVCWDTAEAAAAEATSWQLVPHLSGDRTENARGAGEIPLGDTTVLCPSLRAPNIPGGVCAPALGLPELAQGWRSSFGAPGQQAEGWYCAKCQHSFYHKLGPCHLPLFWAQWGDDMGWGL